MILVTGANGLSGSAVIREFARQHSPVRALVRSRAKARALETLPTVELVEGDMLRAETLADALSGVDRVLLISSADQQMVETQSAFIDASLLVVHRESGDRIKKHSYIGVSSIPLPGNDSYRWIVHSPAEKGTNNREVGPKKASRVLKRLLSPSCSLHLRFVEFNHVLREERNIQHNFCLFCIPYKTSENKTPLRKWKG